MKKAGTDIKLSVTFQTQAFDLAPQVSQLVATPTDLIGVGSGPEPATRLAQELRRQGGKARLVAGSTIADPELPRLMGAAGDGTTIPTAFYSGLDDRTKKFEAEFISKAKAAGIDRSAAAQFDAATYDIVLIYAHAIKTANVIGDPGKAHRRANCNSRRNPQDEGLSCAGRSHFVRHERRRGQTRLHYRNEETANGTCWPIIRRAAEEHDSDLSVRRGRTFKAL
jgi:ABC-type branched-subunit amino acid transport system substrate-binding protein